MSWAAADACVAATWARPDASRARSTAAAASVTAASERAAAAFAASAVARASSATSASDCAASWPRSPRQSASSSLAGRFFCSESMLVPLRQGVRGTGSGRRGATLRLAGQIASDGARLAGACDALRQVPGAGTASFVAINSSMSRSRSRSETFRPASASMRSRASRRASARECGSRRRCGSPRSRRP